MRKKPIKTKNTKILQNNLGATAVEFALVAFPLMVLIMGIVEFSLLYYANSVIENSTTVSARLGITNGDYSGNANVEAGVDRVDMIRNNIVAQSRGLLDPDMISITCQSLGTEFNGVPDSARGGYSCGGAINNNQSCNEAGSGGQVVIYTVSYCWNLLTPLAGLFNSVLGSTTTPNNILLTSSLLVRNERF